AGVGRRGQPAGVQVHQGERGPLSRERGRDRAADATARPGHQGGPPRQRPGHGYFTAPIAMPRTRCRCIHSARIRIGTMTVTLAAALGPISRPWTVRNDVSDAGRVMARTLVSATANMYSFHVAMKQNVAVATSPGRAIGSTTDQ